MTTTRLEGDRVITLIDNEVTLAVMFNTMVKQLICDNDYDTWDLEGIEYLNSIK
jgi:hypothetical protein